MHALKKIQNVWQIILKSFLAMINGTCWLKINKGKMDESDISMEQAMGMMIPTIAAVRESRVELFE